MISFSGIYAPIVTPFNDDETVAFDKLEFNLLKWADQGLDGVVMPGSNSESVFLSKEEKIEIWKVCADVLKVSGTRFLAGTGAETTSETIELTRIAAEIGAEATLVLPPFFYKSQMQPEVLKAHYRAVAEESSIPLLVYNVPAFTGVDFTLPTLEALADHRNIIGIKDSSSNVVKMASLRASCPDFKVFAGTASALLPFLSIGAAGGIMALANFAALPLQNLRNEFLAGDIVKASKIQLALAHINSAVTARYGVPGLKYAMNQTGFWGGGTRRPLLPLKDDARADLDHLLAALKLD